MLEIIANVLAIIAAPLIALGVGTSLQRRRLDYERKYNIFRTLMGERATLASPANVAALNLIDVEFKDKPKVLASWRAYYDLVSSQEFSQWDWQRQLEAGKRARSQLLLDMVKALGIKQEFQLGDFERGYRPKQLTEPEEMSRAIGLAINEGVRQYGAIPIVQIPAISTQPPKT